MDLEALRISLEQATLGSLAIGFTTGFLFSFNPVALAAIPVSLAYVTKAQDGTRAFRYGAMFVAGMLVTHLVLGLIAGQGGAWVQRLFGREWGLVLGPLLIVLGLMWTGWIRVPLPSIPLRARQVTSLWGALGLGGAFSVAVCPFCTPALLVLLGVAAGIGSPLFGGLLLLSFAVGRTVPVLIGAVAIDRLKRLSGLQRSQRIFEVVSGLVLMLAGLYMLNAYFVVIPELAL